VLFALGRVNFSVETQRSVGTQATRMVANISDAMLRLIAVNEPTSKRCGWRGGVLLKPLRLRAVCL